MEKAPHEATKAQREEKRCPTEGTGDTEEDNMEGWYSLRLCGFVALCAGVVEEAPHEATKAQRKMEKVSRGGAEPRNGAPYGGRSI
jgi:hypothetical protein